MAVTMTLTGRLADITSRPVEQTTRVTIKKPAFAPGPGVEITSTQPALIPYDRDGRISVDVVEGVGWIYLDGDGWSDSIRFVAARGMTTIWEAVVNALPVVVEGKRLITELGKQYENHRARILQQFNDSTDKLSNLAESATRDFNVNAARQIRDIVNLREELEAAYEASQAGQSIPLRLTEKALDNRYVRSRDYAVIATEYGVVSDGKTDTTLALNTAMTVAREQKKPVYIPAGRYRVDGTVDISGCRIFGDSSSYQNKDGTVIVGSGENTAFKQAKFDLPSLTMEVRNLRFEQVETGLDFGYTVSTVVDNVVVISSGTSIKLGTNMAVGPLWCKFTHVVGISSGAYGLHLQGSQWCNANMFDTCEFKGAVGEAAVCIEPKGGYGAVKNVFTNCEFAGNGAGVLTKGTNRGTTIADCYIEPKGPAIVSSSLTSELYLDSNIYGSSGNDTVFRAAIIDHDAVTLSARINGGWVVIGNDARQARMQFIRSVRPSDANITYLALPNTGTTPKDFVLQDVDIKSEVMRNKDFLDAKLWVRRDGNLVRVVATTALPQEDVKSVTIPTWARPAITTGFRPVNQPGEIYIGADGAFIFSNVPSGVNVRFDTTYLAV